MLTVQNSLEGIRLVAVQTQDAPFLQRLAQLRVNQFRKRRIDRIPGRNRAPVGNIAGNLRRPPQ
ncbi:hypothetical protein D3C76_1664150 [compost metagenome]